MCTYSDAFLQKITYSSYYKMNCAKGGVFTQLCGWIGSCHLWVGAISDTEYMNRTQVMKCQELFVKLQSQHTGIPFFNVLDRGYRISSLAWTHGKQVTMQPSFTSASQKFSSNQVLYSASVASDRSGNERAVNRLKMSHRLSRGIGKTERTDCIASLWLTWGFQVNFMFEAVL